MLRKVGCFYLVVGMFLSGLLAACGSESTLPALPAAIAPTTSGTSLSAPKITPFPSQMTTVKATVGPPPGVQPLCTFSANIPARSLATQITQVSDIIQVQVLHIGPKVWNTADGNQPEGGCRDLGQHYQYSPVEITVKESYKGTLAAGSKLTLWQTGAPGSLIIGNYVYFPSVGESLIYFLDKDQNVRPDTPKTPLVTRSIYEIYYREDTGRDRWAAHNTNTPFSREYLKALIKEPTIEPTPTPFIPPPTPTAYSNHQNS